MALCPYCKKDVKDKLEQTSKEDHWLCNCGDYHKGFPYKCPKNKDKSDPNAYCATIMQAVEGKEHIHKWENIPSNNDGMIFRRCKICGLHELNRQTKGEIE